MRRLDGKRHQQIAAELQVSERHVEHVLYRTGRMLAGTDLEDFLRMRMDPLSNTQR